MMAMSQRITVKVTDKTHQALEKLTEMEERSITDLVNRSVQLYAAIANEGRRGSQLAIKKSGSDEFQIIHMI